MMFSVVAALTLCGGIASTQDEVQPTNDLPNPYQSIAPWAKLPEGRTWGALNAVDIDRDGESIWVADRCGANPDTHLARQRSSTTAALVQLSRRS